MPDRAPREADAYTKEFLTNFTAQTAADDDGETPDWTPLQSLPGFDDDDDEIPTKPSKPITELDTQETPAVNPPERKQPPLAYTGNFSAHSNPDKD